MKVLNFTFASVVLSNIVGCCCGYDYIDFTSTLLRFLLFKGYICV